MAPWVFSPVPRSAVQDLPDRRVRLQLHVQDGTRGGVPDPNSNGHAGGPKPDSEGRIPVSHRGFCVLTCASLRRERPRSAVPPTSSTATTSCRRGNGSRAMRTCTCGATNEEAAVYCEACGRVLDEAPRAALHLQNLCAHCSKAYPGSASFCDVCGRRLSASAERTRRLVLSDPGGRTISV